MQKFDIFYYDGETSVSHSACLSLYHDSWLIEYSDPLLNNRIVRWEINQIERDMGFTSIFIFRYGDFPKQTLECKNEHLLDSLKQLYPDQPFFDKKIDFLLRQNTTLILGLAVVLIGSLVGSYLYILPWFAEKISIQIPISMEIKFGEMMYENTISHYKKIDSLTVRVNNFVKDIDFKTDYPIDVTVVQENEINAFAMPGGHIVIYDKLLRQMKSKDELAALLAHEVSHVHYRHSLKSIFRSLSGYLAISLLLNDLNGIAAVLAENSDMLVNLSYSRSLEQEADEKAVEILRANNINLYGLLDLLTLLEKGNTDSEPFELLSTHPLTKERIAFAKKMANKQVGISANESLEDKWKAIHAIEAN